MQTEETREASGPITGLLAAAALLVAVVAVGFLIAGLDDALHTFEDQGGATQVALSTETERDWLRIFAVSAVLVGLLWYASSALAAKITGRTLAAAARLDALSYLPLAALLLAPLRYVPGLARASAPLYLLSSTLALPLFVLACVLVVALKRSLLARPYDPEDTARLPMPALSDRAVGWLVFAALAALLAVTIPLFSANWTFGGDEPHYLIITHSIAEDLDVAIEDDHDSGVWRRFTAHQIHPQYFVRATDGAIIGFHKIGLPLLAALPYRLAGKLGALWLVGLLAALAAANTYWLVVRIVPDRRAALLATAWVALTVPMLPLSHMFFSEMPSAALTLIALNLVYQPGGRPPRLAWLALILAWFLPWLHTRGFVTAAVLTAMLAWRLRARPLAAGAAVLAAAALALTIPLWNMAVYGEFSLLAEMGPDQNTAFSFENVPRGLGGLLLDQEFGLVLYNPVVLVALAGLGALWRRSREAFIWAVLVVGSCVGPSIMYRMWWGGGSPPGRYYVAIMPLAALPLAALLAGRRGEAWRRVVLVAGACAVAIAALLMIRTDLLANQRDGTALVLTAVSAGGFDAVEWWPSFIFGTAQAWPLAAALLPALALGALAAWLVWASTRRAGADAPWSRALALAAALAVSLAAGIGYCHLAEAITPGEPSGSQPFSRSLDLLYQQRARRGGYEFIDQGGGLAPGALPPRRFSAHHLYSMAGLEADPVAPRRRSKRFADGAGQILIQPASPLWAGEYRLLIELRSENTSDNVLLEVRDLADSPRADAPPQISERLRLTDSFSEHSFPLRLADSSAGLRIGLAGGSAIRFNHVVLLTRSLTTVGDLGLPPQHADSVCWRFDGYKLYLEPGAIFPPEGDGFWVGGDRDVAGILVCERELRALDLRMRIPGGVQVTVGSGPGNRITIGNEGPNDDHFSDVLNAYSHTIGGKCIAELDISASGSYIPAQREAGSSDERRLGAFLRIRPVR